MPSSYTPSATRHATLTLPSGGDLRNSLSVNTPLEEVADNVEHSTATLLSNAALNAIMNSSARTAASSYSGTFYGGAASSGLTVIVGTGGEIQTSVDHVTWTKRTPAGAYAGDFYAACLLGSTFIIAGTAATSNGLQTSTDGSTWTARTPAVGTTDINAMASNGTTVVAVGAGGIIQTTTDGVTWSLRTPAASYAGIFTGAAYHAAGALFVIVGTGGEIQTSPDGVTWTRRTPAAAFAGNFNGVTSNGSLLVASGFVAGGVVQYSSNGITWASGTNPSAGLVCWTGHTFLHMAAGTLRTSREAVTWTSAARRGYSSWGRWAFKADSTTLIIGDSGLIRQSLAHG